LVLIQFVVWCLVIFVAVSRRRYSLRRSQPAAVVVTGEPAIVLPNGDPS
jgi:hypothetical protein